MSDRNVPTSASPAPVTGPDYMDAVAEKLGLLFGGTPFVLTNLGGTADDITADVDPELSGAVQTGMSFWLTPADDNTGAVTLAIGGGSAIDVKDDAGNALVAGSLKTDQAVLLVALGGEFRAMNTVGTQKINNYQTLTADGNWTKPAGCPDDALVDVELWAGGGGGGTNNNSNAASGGGGGGGYVRKTFRAGDLSSTEAVTIGAGGAAGSAGGTSSFGSHFSVFGGGRGASTNGGGNIAATGGNGGGALRTGGNGSTDAQSSGVAASATVSTTLGDSTAGAAGTASVTSGNTPTGNPGADGYFGGGGGGSGTRNSSTNNAGDGGAAVYGGGGGAAKNASAGGTSIFGGNGGGPGSAGTAPGGGGGHNAAGARGECRVHTIG